MKKVIREMIKTNRIKEPKAALIVGIASLANIL
jgi:hypothetical protein